MAKTTPRPAPSMGTGLFTLCPVTQGTELIRIDTPPLTAVLDSARLADTCAGCYDSRRPINNNDVDDGNPGELKACTRCRVVRYCGKNCQLKDWRFAHSLECPIFARLSPRILPNNARAVLRIVLRYKNRKCSQDEFDAFLKLDTHDDGQRREDVGLAARAVKEYSGTDMDEDQIASFFARLSVNTFNLVAYDFTSIGLYLDPYSSLMNHSCDYNAIVVFDGDRMAVKAVRPIAQDEQVFVSYIDTTYCVTTRRRQLKQRYFFDCECAKCTRELGNSKEGLAEVEKAEAAGEALINSASQMQDANEIIQNYKTGLTKILKSMPSTQNSNSNTTITRQPLVALRNELTVALINAGHYDDAWIQCAIEFLKIDPVLYPSTSHPLRRIHAWRLAKLTASTDQGQLAQRFRVDPGVVLWHVLQWLVDGEGEACSAPLLQAQIRAMYREVSQVQKGTSSTRMEWSAVEERLEYALQELAVG